MRCFLKNPPSAWAGIDLKVFSKSPVAEPEERIIFLGIMILPILIFALLSALALCCVVAPFLKPLA
jgi:hypothetical protein